MDATLGKLRPDRDLQCYFYRPSAIAALSEASANGFVVSGTWRQQFDWAVVEWNRDNVFEHPSFRYLPDGDLSSLTLSYEESRTNCIGIDSTLYPTIDWPMLRIWADPQDGLGERIYYIPLARYSQPIQGSYAPATLDIELQGTVTPGDYVGVSFQDEHYPYQMTANPIDFAVSNIVDGINAFSPTLSATSVGAKISISYLGTDSATGRRRSADSSVSGAEGNRLGLYTYVSDGATENWNTSWKNFSGGTSPTNWRITLPFSNLIDRYGASVPSSAMRNVRKMRWTYAADLQSGPFTRSEFQVSVKNWQVSGPGQSYAVAGPGSRRIEDDDPSLKYVGDWHESVGYGNNFSGGKIHWTQNAGDVVSTSYSSAQQHELYLGTRLGDTCAKFEATVDGTIAVTKDLRVPGEDVLVRVHLGSYGPGEHRVQIKHVGPPSTYLYFDFVGVAVPSQLLPAIQPEQSISLATDWDTDHSLALAPERTAWMIQSLGFHGRVNHYAGALLFYELASVGNSYSFATVTFSGFVSPNRITQIYIGRTDQPASGTVAIAHLNLIGDSPETLAKGFELKANSGFTAIWASAIGRQLTIYSRSMGVDGNLLTVSVDDGNSTLQAQVSGPTFMNGQNGTWTTDLTATSKMNRAARDWTRAFCKALVASGHDDVTVAFSTELQHGDPSEQAGIAQRYPSGRPVIVSTPALQTNFSPTSTAYWKQVYLEMAQVQISAGLIPYLQFGEIQWWYYNNQDQSGMPFFDSYTRDAFRSRYGREISIIANQNVDPSTVPEECVFLPGLIGAHTTAIASYVRAELGLCRFEVLYPTDVNNTALNRLINFPKTDWTPSVLDCLKTESFTYTYSRNLDLCAETIDFGTDLGFSTSKRSHLVGASDASSPWIKEARLAESTGLQSVVIFALDQVCLIGYDLPLSDGVRRSLQMG